MSNILKQPYEISIWEEELVFEILIDGESSSRVILPQEAASIGKPFTLQKQYYREKKIAIIGSDTMSAPWRAVNPVYTPNVNGSETLSFTMYSKYYDEDKDELLDNPFTKKMVNERKVKLLFKNEWHDFIIKNIQESSEGVSYTYTAKSLFINELSKNGFQLEFNTKLKNNMGTIDELADKILENSDWKRESGDVIQQYKEEPLYQIVLTSDIIATEMLTTNTISIAKGQIIYGFYQCVNNKSSYFQFLYNTDGYTIDDDRIITNSPNYYVDNAINNSTGEFIFFDSSKAVVTDKYRGKRLVRSLKTAYDPVVEKYVNVYKNGDNIYYGYTETEYLTSDLVRNYVTNPSNYTSTSGWLSGTGADVSLLTIPILPPINGVKYDENTIFNTYLTWTNGFNLLNSCISENRSIIKSFSKGETYVLRAKYGYKNGNSVTSIGTDLQFYVCEYKIDDNGKYVSAGTNYFTFQNFTADENGYYKCEANCITNVTYDDFLKKKINLLIVPKNSARTYCLEDIQFFKKVEHDGKIVLPNTTIKPEVKIKYIYYLYDEKITDKDKIQIVYQGYSPSSVYAPDYNSNCEKIRNITASESNRFNLIQSLCETFECWARFRVEHNQDTGEILLDENGRQKKWISFHEYIGKDNSIGFKYGINLKSIQRTVDSEEIVSKLIVKNNSNEFATNGFCSIARADENPIKENFILDFSYYINQGLLDYSQFNNDLYLTTSGYIGYYQKLKELNATIRENANLQAELTSVTLPRLRSQYQDYETKIDSSEKQLISLKTQVLKTTGITYESLLEEGSNSWWKNDNLLGLMNSIMQLQSNITADKEVFNVIKNDLYGENGAENKLTACKEEIKKLTEQKQELNKQFYQKYSRFIQEGSWISEDYIDDDLYFLDGESTLHTSSQPKVTYNINVIELSQVEGYELYDFKVGDKTFIEDTEFFGWIDSIRSTPYKEEVVVSEVKYNLEDPVQNSITVKNYKTQFEDLFQRITAVTTSVQFSTGDYQRAAKAITNEGTLSSSILQNSLANNNFILSNSENNSNQIGPNGFTTTNLSSPNEIVRIVGGGIFLTNDFGATWSTGITGNGINANCITTGVLNTKYLQIWNGDYPTFRWEPIGLSAYSFEMNNQEQIINYNAAKYVRFDRFGLYGIESNDNFKPKTVEEVQENSAFSLTWNGFMLRSHNGNGEGYISISTDNDFQLVTKDSNGNKIDRIKIGRISQTQDKYGIIFRDNNGNVTLKTDDSGRLFLTDIIRIGPDPDNNYTDRVKLGAWQIFDTNGNLLSSNKNGVFSKIFSVMGDTSAPDNRKYSLESNETLAIFDDGTLVANKLIAKGAILTEANVEGTIIAKSGKIGNLTIEDYENTLNDTRGIRITSQKGFTFKESDVGITPAQIELTAELIGLLDDKKSYKWEISKDFLIWTPIANVTNTFNFIYENQKNNFDLNGVCYVKVSLIDSDDTTVIKSQFTTITLIKNGAIGKDGVSAITYQIESNLGFIINESAITANSVSLTARIYEGSQEIDADGKFTYTWYYAPDGNSEQLLNTRGKTVQFDLNAFEDYTQIYFKAQTLEGD